MKFISNDKKVLVIIGPSAAGKSTIVQNLEQQGLIAVTPTWTTRPPRPGEVNIALEHKFVSDTEFYALEKEGFFLETVRLFGLDYRYGLPKIVLPTGNRIPTIMLRAPLLSKLPKYYPNFCTYQIEDELKRTRERLLARQKAGEPLGTRLKDYEDEVILGRQLADRVFINTKQEAVTNEIAKVLKEDFVV